MPAMTAAAREWMGLMLAMTSGGSAAAAPGSRMEAARAAGWSQVGRRRAVMGKPLLGKDDMLYCIIRRGSQEFANRSEEHTSELQSLMRISYAVFCLNKKRNKQIKKKT